MGGVIWGGGGGRGRLPVCEAATRFRLGASGVPVWVFLLTSWMTVGRLLNTSDLPLQTEMVIIFCTNLKVLDLY